MTSARRRGRPAPLRWGGLLAVAGLLVAGIGAGVQFGRDQAGASPTPGPSASPSARPGGPKALLTPPSESPAEKPDQPSASSSAGTRKGTPATTSARPGRPTRISLPQLGITAPVVGIKAVNGQLIPPADATKVGWWSGGAQPGAARGSAVITGHTVHNGGGAFDDLDQLRPGTTVTVTTARGTLRYQVTSVTTYRKRSLAAHAGELFDQQVKGRLVLVTCEDWNGQVYLSNVVVVARPMA
ncbi:LPXTG-site transpeptidase (sortase) family protein [Kribbella amoyensis]|uniref:LPXTG-site transpeptidase (Sortase) family protein n=1 Tax=Kribbella amoyensis TaxID=996641 RepID=A0A561BV20_9ACTN|nr:class F sortase [Kribbella amoyensis]TWD82736.1 LPXTG-site transpeptidase (sortase) family protein [Kribbella amoyensis]